MRSWEDRRIQKAIVDDDFMRHLLMYAARLSTYPSVLEVIRSITMARDTLTGPGADVRQLCQQGQGIRERKGGKGKKGKGNNKEKEKDPATNPGAEMICHCCTGKVTASETAEHSRKTRTRRV